MKSFLVALVGILSLFLFGPRALAEPATELKLMEPTEGLYLSVNAHVKTADDHKFKIKVARVIEPGKRVLIGGSDSVTIEAQYDMVGDDILMSWFVLGGDKQPIATNKVTIQRFDGAKIEGQSADGSYQIEFWDVTKKRAEAKRAAGLKSGQ